VLIDQIAETVWHEGGGLFFGPQDGFLYLSVGDDARERTTSASTVAGFQWCSRLDVDMRGGEVSHAPVRKPLPAGSVAENYFIPNQIRSLARRMPWRNSSLLGCAIRIA